MRSGVRQPTSAVGWTSPHKSRPDDLAELRLRGDRLQLAVDDDERGPFGGLAQATGGGLFGAVGQPTGGGLVDEVAQPTGRRTIL